MEHFLPVQQFLSVIDPLPHLILTPSVTIHHLDSALPFFHQVGKSELPISHQASPQAFLQASQRKQSNPGLLNHSLNNLQRGRRRSILSRWLPGMSGRTISNRPRTSGIRRWARRPTCFAPKQLSAYSPTPKKNTQCVTRLTEGLPPVCPQFCVNAKSRCKN